MVIINISRIFVSTKVLNIKKITTMKTERDIRAGEKYESRFRIIITRVNEKSVWWRGENWGDRTKDTRYSINTVLDLINSGYWKQTE